MTLTVIVVYLALVLSIGLASHRLFRGTGEDYFLATRSIGAFVLLMSLFGTHMTAFSLLGASGEGYRLGIGVFGLMASSSALVVPVVFYFIGRRLWSIGKRHSYVTQVQFVRDRWGSDALGTLLFPVLVLLVVPYLLIGVMGGGMTLNQITEGLVPTWLGSLLVCGVVLAYVTYGGLRGTAWVNTFQTLVFMILGALAFFWIVRSVGGLDSALARVAEQRPELLVRGDKIPPLKLLSYMTIPLSVGMFPHIFMHWLTARSADSFRLPIVAYPLCVAVVWIPSVLLGVIGSVEVPGLAGPAANGVLVAMIKSHAPELLAGLLAAGVFAAIMSSLDSQTLSLGTMFTTDVVRHFRAGHEMSEARQVRLGRLFVVTILALTYLISLVAAPSIFKLGVWSFTGFSGLFPIVVAALYWRRSTSQGVTASILTVAALWIFFFVRGWSVPGYTVGGSGIIPAAVILLASSVALIAVSLLTTPPESKRLDRFFGGAESRGMKLAYITPGAAGMICGSCLHDNTLASALMRREHDVALVPIYTPIRTDHENVSMDRVFYGAINVFLEQKSALFRHTPWLVDKLLSTPRMLNWASSRGASIDATELGAMTLSMLQGEDGKQAKELERLCDWLAEDYRPDLVHLSNSMLLGMARRIKQRLGVPVLCSVQGEDIFLEELKQPYRSRVHETIRERAKDAEAFVSTSSYYVGYMTDYLAVAAERIHHVPLGLKLTEFERVTPLQESAPFVIGYLARICPEKGLHLLVQAVKQLVDELGPRAVRLRVAGYLGHRDKAYLDGVTRQIGEWGMQQVVEILGEVDLQGKIDFLSSIHVLSVPTTYLEPKGRFVLESLAGGVPVVQPAHGAFPEMLEATGGGLLVEPGDPRELAAAFRELISNPGRRRELGAAGRDAVRRDFSDDALARRTLEVYQRYL